MAKEPVFFDFETTTLLRKILADAWASLRPEKKITTTQSVLAERILKCAAQGERDPERLLNAALIEFTAEEA
ncbi:MAG: hypothetical protein ACM3TN_16685 [Alphaproteobacteria bacterium]